MKVKFDKEVEVLYIMLNDLPVFESDEEKPGIILDYAADGSVVSIEILNASRKCSSRTKLSMKLLSESREQH